MSKKKAELESEACEYRKLIEQSKKAKKAGEFRRAVELALASWDYIDGMMRYAERHEDKSFRTIEAIEIVLEYGPLLLARELLDRLQVLLKEKKRIDKNTSDNLFEKLALARARLWDVHRIWNIVELNPGCEEHDIFKRLGGSTKHWRSLSDSLEKMSLFKRDATSSRLSLVTRLGRLVHGKCPDCGNVTEAPMAMLLEDTPCPSCRQPVMFVLRE